LLGSHQRQCVTFACPNSHNREPPWAQVDVSLSLLVAVVRITPAVISKDAIFASTNLFHRTSPGRTILAERGGQSSPKRAAMKTRAIAVSNGPKDRRRGTRSHITAAPSSWSTSLIC